MATKKIKPAPTETPDLAPAPLPQKAYMLRTCAADGTSHGGFRWPKEGPVSCPDWDPKPECGHGLHGLLWGGGNLSLLSNADDAIWQIVEIEEWVEIDRKVKVPRGAVVYSGDMAGATVGIAMKWLDHLKKTNAFTVEGGAAIGGSSKLAASGGSSQLAASGYSSQLAASGGSSKLAASGDYSIAMCAGPNSTAAAGTNGTIALTWWDAEAKRFRVVVGYVGEDGIEAGVFYRVENGKLAPTGERVAKKEGVA